MAFYWLMQTYSLALIILGTSYKMLLYEHLYSDEDATKRSLFAQSPDSRWLAGAESAALRFNTIERQQRVSHFFGGSLTVVFVCMDIICLAHRGVKANWHRYEEVSKRKKLGASLHLALRISLPIFTATISQYLTEPNILAMVGLVAVICQLCVRIFASSIFENDQSQAEEEAVELAIKYNFARTHDLPEHTLNLSGINDPVKQTQQH